jgi:hypothetical protein
MFLRMRPCYVVCGYGIPADILNDQNYDIYLRTVFNTVFDGCSKTGIWNPHIVFSGGKSDMRKPYRRTEAQEMMKFFRVLMQRPAVKAKVKAWTLLAEMKSLSTLDNIIYVRDLFEQRSIESSSLSIFCEKTRVERVKAITRKIFTKAVVIPIDFDQSANRYLDPALLQRISREGAKFDLWALKSEANLKKHRDIFKEKFVYLRKAGPDVHVEAVRTWWEMKLKELDA